MILNTYKLEKETNHNMLILDIISNVAHTTVTSNRSVYRMIREYETTHELHSHKKTKHRETIMIFIEMLFVSLVQEFFRNALLRLKVLKVMNEDDDYTSTLNMSNEDGIVH